MDPSRQLRTILAGAVVVLVVTTASLLVFDFSMASGSWEDLPIVRIGQSEKPVETTQSPGLTVSGATRSPAQPSSVETSPTPTISADPVTTVLPVKESVSIDKTESVESQTDDTTRTFVPEEVWIRDDDDWHDDDDWRDRDDDRHSRPSRRDR